MTIEKFLQANVHGSGATPMDVDALAKTKGRKRGGKVKDKGGRSKKFEGTCFWCGVYGHMMEDCQKKAAGKPQVPKSPRGPGPKRMGKSKARRERRPLASGHTVRKILRQMGSHRGGCRSLRWCCQSTREVQSTRLARMAKNPETGTRSVEILQKWKPLCQCCRR